MKSIKLYEKQLIYMDIKDIVKMITKMTKLSSDQEEEIMKLLDQLDEDIDSVEDIDDLTLDNFDFDEIDLDKFDLDKLDSHPFDPTSGGPRGDDFKYEGGKMPDERQEVDINIEDDAEDEPYQGKHWVQVDGVYETFVDIPDDTTEITINENQEEIYVEDPIDRNIPTQQLPDDDLSVELAELTDGGRLLIKLS